MVWNKKMIRKAGEQYMRIFDPFFSDVIDSIFNDTFDSLFEPTFKAPKLIKSMTDNSFPQSNVYVNKDTKEQKITVCLPGVSEKDVRLDREDNVLVLKVVRKSDDNDSWTELQNGFNNPEKCELSWRFDPSKYDLDTTKVDLKDGMMTITVQPTETSKPKRVSGLFGSLEDKKTLKIEDKKSEEESNKKSKD